MLGGERPKHGPGSSHHRSQSSPYFQHTRGLADTQDNESSAASYESTPPVSCHISAPPPVKYSATGFQRHARSRTTTSSSYQAPVITTDIHVESRPATSLSSSLFSGPAKINFDLSPPSSPELSPSKEKEKWSFIPSLKSDKAGTRSERSTSPLRIVDWFQGESAPVALGMIPSPKKESSNPIDALSEPVKPIGSRQKSATSTSSTSPLKTPPKSGSGSGIFSFFTKNSPTPTQGFSPVITNDEFYALDIKEALQPQGPLDPFSPSSFKNLQQNAEGLLARMQIAYKSHVLTVNEARAEQEAQQDELEEARTRTHHLKNQLDDMSARLDQREKDMQKLLEELQAEKLSREGEERPKTVRVVEERGITRGRSRTSLGSMNSTPSMMSDAGSNPSDILDSFRQDDGSVIGSFETHVLDQHHILARDIKSVELVSFGTPELTKQDLSQENTALKARVAHLEKELDGCLELLKDIGLS